MAAGRLTFLCPHLVRAATRSGVASWGSSAVVEVGAARGWGRRSNSLFAKRHGKAVEPVEWEKQQQQPQPQPQESPATTSEAKATEAKTSEAQTPDAQTPDAPPKPEIGKLFFREAEKKAAQEPTKDAPETEAAVPKQQESKTTDPDEAKSSREPKNADPNASPSSQSKQVDSNEPPGSASNKPNENENEGEDDGLQQAKDGAKRSEVLETVFLMGPPEDVAQKPPSLCPPKYVHHFDSYSLVKQLQEGGYTKDNAITIMKGIRGILAHNLDMAQERLVSKSDVENESYLFSAACSELSAEIKNNRRISDEQMRQQRTHLQHEADILTQTLNQELLTLNDNVREIFNDRKMAVREEQKALESAIQKINYKMSIMLSSDSKSEIEGVRWILIRRSVLGIIFMAILTLGTIRYATYVSHERQREADRKKREAEELRRDGGKNDRTSAPDAAAILAAN